MPRPLPALALACAVVSACVPGGPPPVLPAGPGLAAEAPPAPATANPGGPLRVVYGGPRGETAAAAEIALIFDRPMRALGLGPSDPPPQVVLTPAAKGAFHWIGSAALRFDAEAPLPPATAFRVEVPAGARALDGTALAAPYVLDFSTPRPALVESDPFPDAEGVLLDSPIVLTFNQRVSDAEIRRAVTIRGSAPAAEPLAFTVERQAPTRVQLQPARPLPPSDRIHVLVDASLRGEDGDLPAGTTRSVVFSTMGPPTVQRIACEPHPDDAARCDPDNPTVTIELSSYVPSRALARSVVLDPPVAWNRADYEGDDNTAVLAIRPEIKPWTTLRVRLDPARGGKELVDGWGLRPLPAAAELRFGNRASRVSFGLWGTYWGTRAPHDFLAFASNAPGAELSARPAPLTEILAGLAGAAAPPGRGARSVALPRGRLDERVEDTIHLDDLLPPGTRGPVHLLVHRPGVGTSDHEIQLSDLAISARAAHGKAAVLVSGIDDGKPVPGASVEVYRVPERKKRSPVVLLGSAVTGADGSAAVSLSPASPFLATDRVAVVARAGDDWSYAALDAPRPLEVMGVLYTERGIYRPGETAHVAGLFRVAGPDGLTTPRGAEVRVTVQGRESTPVFTGRTTLSEFGTFSLDVPLAADLPLARYRVHADAAGGQAHTRLEVAEYRPTSLAVEATTDASERVRGQSMTCSAEGRYLHGGRMAGTTASLRVRRSRAYFSVPGLVGFDTGSERRPVPPSDAAQATRPLDARGIASLAVPLTFPDMTGPEQLTCEVEVSDLDGQALADHAYTTVHPAEIYVALAEPDHRPLRAGEALSLSALAVTPEGERRSARVHLTAALREAVKGEEKETPLGGCDVTPGKDPAGCPVKLPAKATRGAEIVLRGEATDARGNPVHASFAVPIEDPPKRSPPARTASPSPPASPQLEVHLDQRRYAAGAMVHIDLRSPFADPAVAFITIEREGILWQRVVPLPSAGTRVDVPLTPAMIPGGEVAVTAIAGGEAREESADFEVDASSRELAVTLDTRGEAHAPGEEVDVDVMVKDATGAPARADVTLYAADEGSLSLAYYSMPHPHDHFFSRAGSLARGYEAHHDRMKVGRFGSHRARPPSVRMGATQVSDSPMRGDFRQTAVFAPHLVTDAAGHVRRRVKLPDGLTAYRFMAVAVAEDDRTGTAKATVRTTQPLMARASLPRVIRAGDRFEANVVVSTAGLPEGDVSIEAEAEGLALDEPGPRHVHALPGVPVEARIALHADKPGPARLTVRARLGEARDAMTLTGQVVAPTAPESAAVDGETAGAAAERIASTAGLRPDYGGLAVTVSSGPLAGLSGGIQQLVQYPYGCTEQTVSTMVPLLALRDLARAIEADLPADVGAALDRAVKRVAGNQRADGGFGLWSSSERSQPWVTAWALWGLGEARRRGVAVPDRVEARGQAYFEDTLALSPQATADQLVLAAFLFDLSAEDGHADPALASRLAAERSRLSPSGRALLLHGLAVAGLSPEIRADLHRDLEAFVRLDGNLANAVLTDPSPDLFDSDARATAMILRAFVADTPSHPLVPRLARGLLSQRRDGRFRTTQEAAWALIALDALRRASPPPAAMDARVFLGQAPVGEAHLAGAAAARRFEITMPSLLSQGGAPLTLAASGGPLHYEARLRFARARNPTTPEEAGLVVRRTARPLGPGPRAPGTFLAGELVEVEVDVLTPSPRHFVAVESPLPGGLEAVDAGLRTAGTWIHDLEATPRGARREDRDDRVVYFADDLPAGLTVFRYVARATTAGTFVTPPARAEEMYVPETHGRTAGETVVVSAR